MFDWVKFRTARGGIKIYTCWDDSLMIPDVVNITPAKLHDRYGLKQLVFTKGTIVVEDRAYFYFQLMMQRVSAENLFVTRIKTNTVFNCSVNLTKRMKEFSTWSKLLEVLSKTSSNFLSSQLNLFLSILPEAINLSAFFLSLAFKQTLQVFNTFQKKHFSLIKIEKKRDIINLA